jgi:hypothetical protein
VNFVVYSEDYEYQIHIPLTVADNAAYVPPFCVTAGTAFIYKDSRISGETVARSEFGDSKLTEETLRNIENDALFKNEISKIPSGIDFKNEFEWLKEELAAYYR